MGGKIVDAERKRSRAQELRRAGVSLREIGAAVGVSYDTVRRWTAESGPRPGPEGVEDAGVVASSETGAPAAPAVDLSSVEGIAGELDRVYADVLVSGYSRSAMLRERLLRSRLDVLARTDVCKDHITLDQLAEDRAFLHGVWVTQIRLLDRQLTERGVDAEDLLDRCIRRVKDGADAGEVLNDGK